MASLPIETKQRPQKVGVARVALTGAFAATAFFVVCWLGAVLGIGIVTHMYIALFTSADANSGLAFVQGACLSLAFGLILGTLMAFFYNLLAPLDGR